MSCKPEPISFQGYSGDDHIPVDQVDAYTAGLQSQTNACAGLLDHAEEEGVVTRSGIEGCTEVNQPLSCSDVDHDSEGVLDLEGRALHSDTGHLAKPSEGNRVQKTSPTTTTRSTAGHASQACDSSDQPPISSSENAEEQGDAERDGTRKSKISSAGKASKRRKK